MMIAVMLSLQTVYQLNDKSNLMCLFDPFVSIQEKEGIEMGCFRAISLVEKYGDQLEQQVPLDSTIISYEELKYLTVLHHGYDGFVHVGELIVNASLADEVLEIFKELYLMGYPIEKMKVMSCYDGSDTLSMEDNNSSAFNFRYMTDGKKLSYHAYGLAIDLNPKVNPYVKEELVLPVNGKDYVDRDQCVLGLIKKNDAVYQLFKRYGWTWGGDWTSLKDYQHFEKPL